MKTAIKAALIGLLLLAGAACGTATAKPAAEAEQVTCVDVDRAVTLTNDAKAELQATITSAQSYDVDGAASHTENAASDFTEIAAVWSAFPTVAGPATMAGTEMRDAADALRSGDFSGATADISASNGHIQQATAATSALIGDPSVVPC